MTKRSGIRRIWRKPSHGDLPNERKSWSRNSSNPGDLAIDATAGNGLDTVFLSSSVGPDGTVFAIDKQQEAVERTQAKLDAHQCRNVRLVQGCHAQILQHIPPAMHGSFKAIMLNLGYLPRGEKHVTTRSETTLRLLDSCLQLLSPGGIITIIAYPGHAAGYGETLAVESWCQLPATRQTCEVELPVTKLMGKRPRLYVVQRKLLPKS